MATIKEMQTELDGQGVAYPKGKNAAFYESLLAGETPLETVETFEYINKSKRNYFTENGRCMPGHTIFLSEADAGQYKELERA